MNFIGRLGSAVTAFILIPSALGIAADSPDKLLEMGHYKKLVDDADAPHDGRWAFARFFLLPDQTTYRAALKAHEAGDLIGTFIVMRCHLEGAGVRPDQKLRRACNVNLREALKKRGKPSGLDSYMLSYLSQADATGLIDSERFEDAEDAFKVAGRSDHEHLLASAEAGFAQAMVEEGMRVQQEDGAAAEKWYIKAAELGHAGGMKDLGFMLATGRAAGGKDDAAAMRWTREAAKLGNIYAMINIAAFDVKLEMEGTSAKEGRESIDRAVASGHYLGALEKGLALLVGGYGFEIDKPSGMALLQKAADSGHSIALGDLANFYASGVGVDRDYKMAALLGKAAYLQGRESAQRVIAACYERDPELGKDEESKDYWGLKAMGAGLAFAMGRDKPDGAIAEELERIDPFKIKLR